MKKIIFALLIVCTLLVCPIIADTSVTLDVYSLCTVAKQGDGTDPWTTLQSATTGTSASCGSPNCAYMRIPATAITSEYAQFARGFITFNTNIGPTNEWKSGILSIKASIPLDDFNSNLSIGLAYPDTPGTVGTSDYNNWDTSEYGEIDISGMSEGNWYNITIDVSDFSNVGYTVLSALAAIDKYNTPPAWVSAAETRVKITDAKLYGTYGAITTPTPTPTIPPTANYEVIVSGLDTEPIENANVSIWYNGAYQDSELTFASGSAYFVVPPYRFVNGTVTLSGYQTAYFDTYVYPSGSFEIVTLYTDDETAGSGDSYGNYILTFKDANTGDKVGYSNIEVYSDSGYTTLFYDEYSNSDGIWTGLIPMNVTYYYKYPETIGYYSQSWSYNLTSSPGYKTVNLVPKSGATATVTPTPTVTVTTITPTVTYTYNTGNLSTLNVKERFTNLLVLAGFQNAESADLIFAMIIVLGCAALIGWITLSGSGAGMGAIIGFVFALGLGLIPLWILISAVFLGSLYLALKLFGETGE
jgi:hypothetical protein